MTDFTLKGTCHPDSAVCSHLLDAYREAAICNKPTYCTVLLSADVLMFAASILIALIPYIHLTDYKKIHIYYLSLCKLNRSLSFRPNSVCSISRSFWSLA